MGNHHNGEPNLSSSLWSAVKLEGQCERNLFSVQPLVKVKVLVRNQQ